MSDIYGSRYYSDDEIDELKGRREPKNDLARAIEYLGAVLVSKAHDESDGFGNFSKTHPRLYAFRDFYLPGEQQSVRNDYFSVLPAEQIALLCSQDAYRKYRARVVPIAMPSWWTPEQRFAWRAANLDKPRYYSSLREAIDDDQVADALDRITADLETGAEVPA